jgi:phosphomannomutase
MKSMSKRLIVFDLDGTLAPSKSSIDSEMAKLLRDLLEVIKVSVMSGGDWPQFEKQVLMQLPHDELLNNLSILPTCGTKFFQFDNGWKELYAEDFSGEEKQRIIGALNAVMDQLGYREKKIWGKIIEDRGSQITFSALGQEAPLEEKEKWDPDFAKRAKMKGLLDKLLPEYSVHLGGTTSVDVTKPGIDKAYGIRKLRDTLGVDIKDMIFVGDAIFPGGNDYPAKQAGCYSIKVRDPDESKRVIEAVIACAGGPEPQ